MIFMLYRDDYYNRELADDDTGKSDIELNVSKNKDGETGVVELQFFKKRRGFTHDYCRVAANVRCYVSRSI